jgi:hypothetical protein
MCHYRALVRRNLVRGATLLRAFAGMDSGACVSSACRYLPFRGAQAYPIRGYIW